MALDKRLYRSCVGSIIGCALLGIVAGAIVGCLLPIAVQLCSCVWNIANCAWSAEVMLGNADLIQWSIGGAALGGIIGIAFGLFDVNDRVKLARKAQLDEIKEKKRQEEEERNNRFDKWCSRVYGAAADVISALEEKNKDRAGDRLEHLWRFGEETKCLDEQDRGDCRYSGMYCKVYGSLGDSIIAHTSDFVAQALHMSPDETALEGVEVGLLLLLAYCSHDTQAQLSNERAGDYLSALRSVRESQVTLGGDACAITFNGYGEVEFCGEDPRAWSAATAQARYAELEKRLELLAPIAMNKDIVAGASSLDPSFFISTAQLMWHYADAAPFNVEKYDFVRSIYNAFTAHVTVDEKEGEIVFGTTEEVLTRLYAKNKLGGASMAKQEEAYLFAWVDDCITRGDYDSCFHLVSGIAWLELFDFEQRVLKTLVARQVQLTAELQERLGMLENGRTRNVRLFEVLPSGEFQFDSSSIEWNANDFSAFFRKLAMKKASLAYSLALSKWTKTLPLKQGQRILQEDIFAEFKDMVLDFDGEVTCDRVDAAAVDLSNLRYEDATLFSFTSERSRCVSVLFSCEKYGRNLNVTLYTLFTPETGLDVSALEHYATAAKNNIYMESFRESVLQSLDDVLKVEKSIYGDCDDDAPESLESHRSVIS